MTGHFDPDKIEDVAVKAIHKGSFIKKFFIILAMAVVHFVFTKVITAAALSVITANSNETQLSLLARSLVAMSKILYFPVFTFAWYPRQFFPGNLVIIPLFINSLLWAALIYILFVLVRKISGQPEKSMN